MIMDLMTSLLSLHLRLKQRGQLTSIIIQANWHWSAANLDREGEVVSDILRQAAAQILAVNLRDIRYESVHL